MPRRTDIRKILLLGSGPIVIGQACEFDYSGTQACKVLMEEGYRGGVGQLQPGHHHDRPRLLPPYLHRTPGARSGGQDHRGGAAGRPAAHPGGPDRPQPGRRPLRGRHSREVRRRADRRQLRRHPPRRGPRRVPRHHGLHRPARARKRRGQIPSPRPEPRSRTAFTCPSSSGPASRWAGTGEGWPPPTRSSTPRS